VTRATLVIEADWNRDGLYNHAQSDITGDVQGFGLERGRDYASVLRGVSVAGRADIDVLNTSGKYSRSNTSSVLSGLLEPGVPVRVRTTSPSAATLWTGYLSQIEAAGAIEAGQVKVARLKCTGPLARLRALGKVTVAPQTDIATGDAIDLILDAAGWAAGARSLDQGQTTLDRYFVEDRNALEAIRELEETERGFLLESATGSIVFEDRHHRLKGVHLTSQATFSDGSSPTLPYRRLHPRDREQEIFNDVTIPVRHFTEQSLAVLWTYQGDDPVVQPGESLVLWASYPPPATPAGRYVSAWTTPSVGTDITQTGVSNGDLGVAVSKFSKSMKLTVTNNGAAPATLTLVQARGTAVTEDEPTLVTAEDTSSQSAYGERSVPRPGEWHQSLTLAQGIADFLISRYADPLEPLPAGFDFSAEYSSALMTQALTRDLSDRITLVATNSPGADQGIDGDYFIEAIRHDFTPETGLDVFYDLSPAAGDSGYWAIGEVGFSEIGETTRLAPV